MRLRIRHRTVYRYTRPVRFSDHRLLVTPRATRDVAIIWSSVQIDPAAALVWSEDAAGNTVALALIAEAAATLTIEAEHEVLHSAEPYPVFRLDPAAHRYPLPMRPMTGHCSGRGCSAGTRIKTKIKRGGWRVSGGRADDTLRLLNALNEAVGAAIAYRTRDERKARNRPRAPWRCAADRAVTWRRCFSGRCGGWAFQRERCRAICSIQGWRQAMSARPMPGVRSSCRVQGGSRSTRPSDGSAERARSYGGRRDQRGSAARDRRVRRRCGRFC